MTPPTPPPAQVYALPDGRVAVRVESFAFGDVWLLVDRFGGTCVVPGALSAAAVELHPRVAELGSTAERAALRAVCVDRVVREWRRDSTDRTALWAALVDLAEVWPP